MSEYYVCVLCQRQYSPKGVVLDCVDYSSDTNSATCLCGDEAPVVSLDELIDAWTRDVEVDEEIQA